MRQHIRFIAYSVHLIFMFYYDSLEHLYFFVRKIMLSILWGFFVLFSHGYASTLSRDNSPGPFPERRISVPCLRFHSTVPILCPCFYSFVTTRL